MVTCSVKEAYRRGGPGVTIKRCVCVKLQLLRVSFWIPLEPSITSNHRAVPNVNSGHHECVFNTTWWRAGLRPAVLSKGLAGSAVWSGMLHLTTGFQLPRYSTLQFTSTQSDSCTPFPGKLTFNQHVGSEAESWNTNTQSQKIAKKPSHVYDTRVIKERSNKKPSCR